MSYSDITFKDKNITKRWLQRRRLATAIDLSMIFLRSKVILDFGAGGGELCKLISSKYPMSNIVCYEPTPNLMSEARENLAKIPHVELCSNIKNIFPHSVDLLFCLEVFEHLPGDVAENVFEQIHTLLSSEGIAVIGVPVEVGLPALYKGIFRMARRFGAFDATPKNILLAMFGIPPKERPIAEIAPGFLFHYHHMGFDHRRFYDVIRKKFLIIKKSSSPFPALPSWVNPEVYFVVKRK